MLRGEDGVLVLRWEADTPVDVGLGSTPVAAEHTPVATSVAGGLVRLDGPVPWRTYVSLAPSDGPAIVAAERRVPFSGITNLRDVGGYPTAGGGATQWGKVFRADALHKLTADDLVAFGELGVANRLRPARRRRARRVPWPGAFAPRVDRRASP